MPHRFMEAAAERLADRGVATFRYQFPYMEKGSRRPDYRPILLKTVRSALAAASDIAGGVPLFAGGKSMGGRMTSMAAAGEPLESVRGIVFFGFPLHPVGKPGVERADHLRTSRFPCSSSRGPATSSPPWTCWRRCAGVWERGLRYMSSREPTTASTS